MRIRRLLPAMALVLTLTTGCLPDAVDDLGVGDCFSDTTAFLAGEATTTLPTVPCDEPHNNEVYLATEYPGSSYDLDAIAQFGIDTCFVAFEPYVGRRYEDSILEFDFLFPDRTGWDLGSRDIKCFVFRLDGQVLRGSVRGKGL